MTSSDAAAGEAGGALATLLLADVDGKGAVADDGSVLGPDRVDGQEPVALGARFRGRELDGVRHGGTADGGNRPAIVGRDRGQHRLEPAAEVVADAEPRELGEQLVQPDEPQVEIEEREPTRTELEQRVEASERLRQLGVGFPQSSLGLRAVRVMSMVTPIQSASPNRLPRVSTPRIDPSACRIRYRTAKSPRWWPRARRP